MSPAHAGVPHRERRTSRRSRDFGERGSATVAGAGLVMAVLALFVIEIQLGSAVAARHRAEAAADLAALASAAQAIAGQEAACRSATRVAERMSTTLTSCELHGWDAVVRVSARPARLVEHFGVANATARAGPVQTDQSNSVQTDRSSHGDVRREIHDERSTIIAERGRQNSS
jgi:secretion/DNA translocation related TadE-like protein